MTRKTHRSLEAGTGSWVNTKGLLQTDEQFSIRKDCGECKEAQIH